MNYKSLLFILLFTTGSIHPAARVVDITIEEAENVMLAKSPQPSSRDILLDIVAALMQIPKILTIGSTDPDHITLAVSLNSIAHSLKTANSYCQSVQQKQQLAEFYDKLKSIAHVYLCLNSFSEIPNNQEYAEINKQLANTNQLKLLSRSKNTKLLQLSMEVAIRGMALWEINNRNNRPTKVLIEIADLFELIRNFTMPKVKNEQIVEAMNSITDAQNSQSVVTEPAVA